jgi:tripartite-type tricarboxylate transporter receptor subunit TctC
MQASGLSTMHPATAFCSAMLFAAMFQAGPVAGQSYPDRPIRLVIGYPPGGGTDATVRLWSTQLGQHLGQQVVIDNRPGAGSMIGINTVAKSKPDGYTIGGVNLAFSALPFLMSKMPYDTEKDLMQVSLTARIPLVLCVHPSLPVRSVKELITLAKKKPGSLNAGSGGNGGPTHLVTELFSHTTGANLVHIPYKGGGPQILAGVSGETPVLFLIISAGIQHIRTGRLIPIGISTIKRQPQLPDVPTIAEAIAMPDFDVSDWHSVIVPAGTPTSVVSRLHQDIVKTLAQSDVRERMAGDGAQIVGSTPAEMTAFLKKELTRWGPLIKAVGIRVD